MQLRKACDVLRLNAGRDVLKYLPLAAFVKVDELFLHR
jgi:hypothetical protein